MTASAAAAALKIGRKRVPTLGFRGRRSVVNQSATHSTRFYLAELF